MNRLSTERPSFAAANQVVTPTGRLKMRDMNLRHQLARVEFAGHENAGPICRVENAGKVSMESQSVKKCLKVVGCICVQRFSFSISLFDK